MWLLAMSVENYTTPRSRSRGKSQTRRPALTPRPKNTPHALVTPSKQHTYQDECFTPKRVLKRTPPPSPTRLAPMRVLKRTPPPTTKLASTRVLKRTPPAPTRLASTTEPKATNSTSYSEKETTPQTRTKKARHMHRSSTPQGVKPQARLPRRQETTPGKEGTLVYELGSGNLRQVQADCFTPKRSLNHSPPSKQCASKDPIIQEPSKTASPSSQTDWVDLVPPPKRWEIPRTPVQTVVPATISQERLAMAHDGERRDEPSVLHVDPPPKRWEIPRTPVQTVVPATISQERLAMAGDGERRDEPPVIHVDPPLTQSQGSTEEVESSGQQCTGSMGDVMVAKDVTEDGNGGGDLQPECDHPDDIQVESASPPLVVVPTSNRTTSSPPISTAQKDNYTLPGLVCTDNDLAFLQRMKNVKQYGQLQSQMTHLDKAIKSAAEQKEQLQHEAFKINHDLAEMRAKYAETVSSINTLISNPSAVLASSSLVSSVPPTLVDATQPPTEAHVAHLRKMNQLMSAQLERVEREVRNRVAEVRNEKEEVETKLREQEQTNQMEKEKLHAQHKPAEREREQLEAEVQQKNKEHAEMENELAALQLQLARLKTTSPAEEDSTSTQESLREKQKAERRLQRIIRRCELCVQRHQILKEMGIRGKRGH